MNWCSTSVRQMTCPIEQIGVANCNDQIAARAFGAVEHVPPTNHERLCSYDAVFATMSKIKEPWEMRWMDALHQLKDHTAVKVVLFQEAETAWPTTRPWEEQKSFIELLGKVDLFLTHNERDVDMWGAFRGGRPTMRWRTSMDLSIVQQYGIASEFKPARPIIVGSSYDQRGNGLMGLVACRNFTNDLWHQNRSTGYEDRTAEAPGLVGVDISKEIPHSGWFQWLSAIAGAYIAVHPMPAAAAGRDQIAFAALGIPCVGSQDLDVQRELFPDLAVNHYDVHGIREKVRELLNYDGYYERVREYAMKRVDRYDLDAGVRQAATIKKDMNWDS